jgi:hypothetical protein
MNAFFKSELSSTLIIVIPSNLGSLTSVENIFATSECIKSETLSERLKSKEGIN